MIEMEEGFRVEVGTEGVTRILLKSEGLCLLKVTTVYINEYEPNKTHF